MPRCQVDGWEATDAYVDYIATLTERATGLLVSAILVRCPECWTPITEPIDVDKARHRIRHAHDDNGPGGICTKCERLHSVTIVHACEVCFDPAEGPGLTLCHDCRVRFERASA